MEVIRRAAAHFIDFHRGVVNIIVHIIGFAVVFISIYNLDWRWFAISIVILESGHVYSHIRKIRPYDFRVRILLWRILLFFALVAIFYSITRLVS